MFKYRFDVILPHKMFTWTDFGRVYIGLPYIPPVATPLADINTDTFIDISYYKPRANLSTSISADSTGLQIDLIIRLCTYSGNLK